MKIFLIVFTILAALIIILFFIPIHVTLVYENEFQLKIKFLWLKTLINFNKNKQKDYEKFSDNKKSDNPIKFFKKIKKPSDLKSNLKILNNYLNIISDLSILMFNIIKVFTIKKLILKISVCGEDSQSTAMNYAEISSGVYTILGFLFSLNEPEKYFIAISPNFLSKKLDIYMKISVKIIMFSMIKPIFEFLKKLIFSKKYLYIRIRRIMKNVRKFN